MNYYYLCDLTTADFYHQRAMLHDLEAEDSENKFLSNKDINTKLLSSKYHLTCFNKIFMSKLSLPITNAYEEDEEQ